MDTNKNELAKSPRLRGFAALTVEQRRMIARMGGIAAHEKGTAHQFSTAEAIAAGKKRQSKPKIQQEIGTIEPVLSEQRRLAF